MIPAPPVSLLGWDNDPLLLIWRREVGPLLMAVDYKDYDSGPKRENAECFEKPHDRKDVDIRTSKSVVTD